MTDLSYKQVVTDPTHQSGNLLDLIFIPQHDMIVMNKIELSITPVPWSDHNLITFQIPACQTTDYPLNSTGCKRSTRFKQLDNEDFKNNVLPKLAQLSTNLNDIVHNWNNTLSSYSHLPAMIKKPTPDNRVAKKQSAPWFSHKLRTSLLHLRKLERKWRNTRNSSDQTTYLEHLKRHRESTWAKRKEFHADILSRSLNKPRELFNLVKSFIN